MAKTAKTFHGQGVLFWLKQDRFKLFWDCFCFDFISLFGRHKTRTHDLSISSPKLCYYS